MVFLFPTDVIFIFSVLKLSSGYCFYHKCLSVIYFIGQKLKTFVTKYDMNQPSYGIQGLTYRKEQIVIPTKWVTD